jgi:hypothetical protein
MLLCYEKEKKNIKRATTLKNNIIKYNKLIKLSIKNNITFVKTVVINGIRVENYEWFNLGGVVKGYSVYTDYIESIKIIFNIFINNLSFTFHITDTDTYN